jgi:hypothetical protein
LLVIVGVVAVVLLVVLGFATGWLALTSEQRPVGKLRPTDLVPRTSVPRTRSGGLESPNDTTHVVVSIPSTEVISPAVSTIAGTTIVRRGDGDNDQDD